MRIQVAYSGRVQGVGFRATVHAISRRHAVTGWVRNEPDGTVLLHAQGEPDTLEAFLSEIHATLSHHIRSETRTPTQHIENESAFTIRHH